MPLQFLRLVADHGLSLLIFCDADDEDQRAREGLEPMVGDELDAFRAPILEQYETEGSPYYSTARLWDDGIIDPRDTRDVLGLCIRAARNAKLPTDRFGVFRM
jgi:3-methylcrotonyl-CoA carboxylase beta subunit